MSKLLELCTLLVEEICGELPGRVFSILQTYGTLSLQSLIQRSNLLPRFAKHGIAVLIQHNLVYHHSTADEGITYYTANTKNAYDLVRIGKYSQLVKWRMGESGAAIVDDIQYSGHIGATEMLSLLNRRTEKKGRLSNVKVQTNGVHATNGISAAEDNVTVDRESPLTDDDAKALERLFESRHVVLVRPMDYIIPGTFEKLLEERLIREQYPKGVKGKEKVEFGKELLKRKRQSMDANKACMTMFPEFKKTGNPESIQSQKRNETKLTGDHAVTGTMDERPRKLRKLNATSRGVNDVQEQSLNVEASANSANAIQAETDITFTPGESSPDNDYHTFRLNHEKFDVSLRSQRLTEMSARCLGEPTSKVYAALLHTLERKISRCYEEDEERSPNSVSDLEGDEDPMICSPSVTVVEVNDALDPTVDLAASIGTDLHAKHKPDHSDKSPDLAPKVNGVNPEQRDLEPDDSTLSVRNRLSHVEQHLLLLAEHPYHFLSRSKVENKQLWRVPFSHLTQTFIQLELENLITSRFGPSATRVVRFLHTKGKLDEKQLANICLIKQKDLRAKLTAMQDSGYVDVQEIPRDSARQPSRTIYLWFFSTERCRKRVLNDAYKAMSRLLQRSKFEKEKVQGLIEKAERTDVRGHEEEYLSTAELAALAEWKGKEEKILTHVGRLDDLVALLRDFLPPPMT